MMLCLALFAACGKETDAGNEDVQVQETQQETKEEASTELAETQEQQAKIVGGVQVLEEDELAEVGGILGQIAEKAASLEDSLDMDEIAGMSAEEQQELIGGLEVLVGQHNLVVSSMNDAFEEAGLDVEMDEETGKVTMDESILFATDEDTVSEEGKAYLDSFFATYASAILENENEEYISEILVVGHTDTSGTYEYNQELSQRRAQAVVDYCLSSENNGLTEDERAKMKELMIAEGRSYDEPVYDADGNVDMDASRRVEFKFMMNID